MTRTHVLGGLRIGSHCVRGITSNCVNKINILPNNAQIAEPEFAVHQAFSLVHATQACLSRPPMSMNDSSHSLCFIRSQ